MHTDVVHYTYTHADCKLILFSVFTTERDTALFSPLKYGILVHLRKGLLMF